MFLWDVLCVKVCCCEVHRDTNRNDSFVPIEMIS